MNREAARLALAFSFVPGAGPILFKRSLEMLGSCEALLKASGADLAQVDRMPRSFVEAWKNKKEYLSRADREIELAESRRIRILTLLDEDYPESLRTIYDPPAVLFIRGTFASAPSCLAIVGSRETTHYGEKAAYDFAAEFSKAGAVVVSGLAKGIDSAAHQGVLAVNGVTWAVLGGGILNSGSYRSPKLAEQILEKGAILSEYPLMESPRPEYYPRRNRIVSGLSSAVVVIEAGRQSGALITAGLALEQGRDVFAVPANIDSVYSEGSNWLLRQGAKLAGSAQDVLGDLGLIGITPTTPSFNFDLLTEGERKMFRSLSPKKPLHLDDWIEQSGYPSAEALSLIGALLLKGVVVEKPGKYYAAERTR